MHRSQNISTRPQKNDSHLLKRKYYFSFVDGEDSSEAANDDDIEVEHLEENNNSSCQRDLETHA
jgi:hypothetical protein